MTLGHTPFSSIFHEYSLSRLLNSIYRNNLPLDFNQIQQNLSNKTDFQVLNVIYKMAAIFLKTLICWQCSSDIMNIHCQMYFAAEIKCHDYSFLYLRLDIPHTCMHISDSTDKTRLWLTWKPHNYTSEHLHVKSYPPPPPPPPPPWAKWSHFADDNSICICVNEKFCILIQTSLKFVLRVQLTSTQHWLR